ncbi:MAG: acyl-CoA dehydrogenase [Deferrisomatales bacterium]
MLLVNPKRYEPGHLDPRAAELVRETIAFFEQKGKARLKEDDRGRVWYADFLAFVRESGLFAELLTPPAYGAPGCRWDTARLCAVNEVLAFYGLAYWYTWQVTILGLGPVWMSPNEELKRRAGELLAQGGIFAFGLSEKEHGADLYSTGMTLIPQADGTWRAHGSKYYIGNGNEAALVSVFGKVEGTGEYVFFAADPRAPGYRCVQNVTASQSYVAELELDGYPVREADLLSRGPDAWDASLNTVNVGKYNLGWASIGICTHAFYEALNHASGRNLYGRFVTDFPHVQQLFTEAYARLTAMKLFALRTADYLRSASAEDRRYLLYDPVMKMKVTTQGEEVVNLLWDVIAAKGFEKDTYFEMAARDIRALPKLEGTVHVNIALILKFMANYLFRPAPLAEVPLRTDPAHDAFLFDQGPTRGLGKIRFHDYRPAFARFPTPNVRLFGEQAEALKALLAEAAPTEAQAHDTDLLLCVGELFTLVVYAQLILEAAALHGVGDDLVDQVFEALVRDFSRFAVALHGKAGATPAQAGGSLALIRRPNPDPERFARVWAEVRGLAGAYEMSP